MARTGPAGVTTCEKLSAYSGEPATFHQSSEVQVHGPPSSRNAWSGERDPGALVGFAGRFDERGLADASLTGQQSEPAGRAMRIALERGELLEQSARSWRVIGTSWAQVAPIQTVS